MGVAAMNAAERPSPDERLSAWLEACDAALASGDEPPPPDSAGLAPDLRPRAARGLAGLHLLHRWLPRTLPSSPAPAVRAADLPWVSLGRFRLVRELGRGGFGRVFLADDPQLGRQVALKVPHPETLTPELRERFHREARAASGLDHPNLVPVYEAGEVGPVCFIVSPYCPGPTLAQWLRERTEPVPFAAAAALVATLANAVQHAHGRGVVHRDLKPGNVLMAVCAPPLAPPSDEANARPQPAEFVPKITDFGLAKILHGDGPDGATRSRVVVGTPSYMAPEQARGQSRDVGPACDVYALGAILYELLTGRPPFQGDSDLEALLHVQSEEPVPPARLRPRTPHDLQTICLKCLRKEPDRRYRSASALADDLCRFLAGQPIHARAAGAVERLWRWCRRSPTRAAATGLAVTALAVVVALAFSLAYQQSRSAQDLRQREGETRAALQEARKQSALGQRQRALRALEQGLTMCERGQVRPGMLYLARSVEIAADLPAPEAADVERAARRNLAAWRPELPALVGLFGHEHKVTAVAFSADGTRLLTGSHDGVIRLWDAGTGRQHGRDLRYPGELRCLAFSPDGQTMAAGGSAGARLWKAADSDTSAALPHPGLVAALTFSPDGRSLLTGGKDGTVRLWRADTGEPDGDPLLHPAPVNAVVFTPDGRTVLTGTGDADARRDGQVHFWDLAARKPLPPTLTHQRAVLALALSPAGDTLLTGSADQSAALWDLATRRRLHRLDHQGHVGAVAFSPDGKTVVTRSGLEARFWDVADGRPVREPVSHRGAVTALAFRPGDGRFLLTGSWDGTARLWEMPGGRDHGRVLPHGADVQAVAFSPDSRLALTGGFDGRPRLWDATTGQELYRLEGHTDRVHTVAFSPDGRLAATGGDDRTVRLWDAATGKPRGCLMGHRGPVRVVTFNPEGDTLLSAGEDGTARLWHAATGEPLGVLPHGAVIGSWAAAFSPDGRTVVTGGNDAAARLWDVATGRPLQVLWHRPSVSAVAFSPDSRLVLTGGADGTAQLWDVATGQRVGRPLRHQEEQVRCVAFSRDGSRLLTGSFDHTARAWDAASQEPLAQPVHHQAGVRNVAFSPDGSLFATASFDHTGRLWDTATGRPVGPTLVCGDWVVDVAFRPDGRAVLFASGDKTARLCDVPRPVEGSAERVRLWAQLVTGMEVSEEYGLHVLDAADWAEMRRRLDELGGPPVP
jgi:WD40 repeat protein